MNNDREENDSEEGAVLIRGSEKPTKRSSVTDRRKRNGGKVTKIIIGLFLHSSKTKTHEIDPNKILIRIF